MRAGPASLRSNARYAMPGRTASRMSVLPSSMNRPPSRSSPSDASVSSPARELRTTSTGGNFAAKPASREDAMCASSSPSPFSTSCLGGLAVAYTSAPSCRASRTAAMPTPPVPAWISTDSPGRSRARSRRPYAAVRNAIGTDAARSYDQPSGIGATIRWSATARGPNAPPNRPNTRSPGARPVTPGPTSVTTPAPSLPIARSSATMPSARTTSRKFSPAARTAMRTWPSPRGARDSVASTRARFSRVPLAVTSRRVPGRGGGSGVSTRASLGTRISPSRRASCGSPVASADGSARQEESRPSTSRRTNRSGFSVCAERTSPQSGAAARPAGSVTSSSGPAAPWVTTTSRDAANASSASHSRSTPSRPWTFAATADARSPGGVGPGGRTTYGAGSSRAAARSGYAAGASSGACSPISAHRMAGSPAGTGVQPTRKSAPVRGSARGPRVSCRRDTGRRVSASIVATGRPAPSATRTETVPGPVRVSRTRAADAPEAYSRTPPNANGSSPPPASPP